ADRSVGLERGKGEAVGQRLRGRVRRRRRRGLALVDRSERQPHLGAAWQQRRRRLPQHRRVGGDAAGHKRQHEESEQPHLWVEGMLEARAMARKADSLAAEATNEDVRLEASLRPKTFDDYVGQTPVVDKLKIYVKAAQAR